jgi:two-component sensor histidine kinase
VNTLNSLVDGLLSRLQGEVRSARPGKISHTEFRRAFGNYGADAAESGLSLEETMAGAVSILRGILDNEDSVTDVPETMAAGSALSAVATGYENALPDRSTHQSTDAANTEPQLNQIQALYRISRAATTSQRPTQLLDVSVRAIADATQSDACAVFLYEEATETLGLWSAVGFNPASIGALSVKPGVGITGLAASQRTPIVAADAQDHPAWLPAQHLGDSVYASQASIPMMIEEPSRLVGVLNVLSIERRELGEDAIAFLRTVANELAIGVEFARLRSQTDEQLRRKIVELGTLQRLSRSVASSLSLSDVLRHISEAAAELTNAEAAALFRLASRGPESDDPRTPVIEYRVGHSRQAADEVKRDALVQLVIESGEARAIELEYTDGPSRLYCLPLRSPRERWGALCVRLAPGSELSEDELALLQAFTDTASIAIENAQLYRDARNGIETASALLQEMHHRVRNNLQTLAALLSLQLRQVDDELTAHQLREAAGRVQAIASVHDLLSDESRLSGATVDAIARLVAEQALVTQRPPSLSLTFDIPRSDIEVTSKQATVLALLVNELVSNAIAHGFRDRESGTVSISATRSADTIVIQVVNDGARVPDRLTAATSRGLGLRIVERLAQYDLGGSFSIKPTSMGTVAEIVFPAASLDPPQAVPRSSPSSESAAL